MSVEDRWRHKKTGEPTKDYKRGKRWRVRNKGARTLSFHKKTDAIAHDVKVNADLLKGLQPFDHTAGYILFSKYVEKWLKERGYSPRGRATVGSRIKNHLTPTFGHLRMCDIQTPKVTAWWSEMCEKTKLNGEKYSASTLELVYVHLGSILRTAIDVDKVIPVHPFDGWEIEVPKRDKAVRDIWEHDRTSTLIEALPERDRPLGLLAATCGHRQGEAFGVALEDVNRFRKEITVRHQVGYIDGKLVLSPPKGGKIRTVPLPDVTATAIAQHAEQHGTTAAGCTCCPGKTWQIVFTNAKNGLISAHAWNTDVWHPTLRSVKLTPGQAQGFHNLRHYFASRLIEGNPTHRGASIEQVRDYMGHRSIRTTSETYGHLFEQAHERARALMDDMFSAGVYLLRTAEAQ